MLQNLAKELRFKTRADLMLSWTGTIGLAIAVGIAYFFAARLSLALLAEPDGVALFWPAAGVSSGVLIAFGRSARLPVAGGVMVATIVVNIMGDRNVWSAVAFALCNAGEALLTAWLIERYFGSIFSLDKIHHVLGLLVAAVVATAVSGIGGMVAHKLFRSPTAPIWTTWQHWFASDAVGIVTVGPLVIGLAEVLRNPPPRNETFEGVAALAVLTVVMLLIVYLLPEQQETVIAVALVFPVLLWIAARYRPAFAAAAAFIVSFTIIWAIAVGIGHFGGTAFSIRDRILDTQGAILGFALGAYVLAALFAERRQHEAMLAGSERRLQDALAVGGVTAYEWDASTDLVLRSNNAEKILGYDRQQPLDGKSFFARVHPDDLPRLNALWSTLNRNNPTYSTTYRFLRLDGREIWFQDTSQAEFDPAGKLVRVKGMGLDVTERKRSEEHQKILMAELDHRVKNVLARVVAIADRTRMGGGSTDEFIRSFKGRIQSMAAAHSLLSQTGWRGVDLTGLVRNQLAPYAMDANITIVGTDIVLGASATQTLAMVLHELVTNAVKYGALSIPGGRVSVSWEQKVNESAPTNLIFVWRELDGPPAAATIQSGYGTSLIRKLVPYELGGNVDLVFASDGAYCRLEFPLEHTSSDMRA
jgi:PAS domain S-box-containing protein